eukprot:gb/GECG01013798.1/.p1 GENE.gb/GECG01013798.1/~~gb/GECG01013798.1/.p1  ORF type:complete len:673 (+),score=65.89 gb/GECG01013798.1/:1-2019(+)
MSAEDHNGLLPRFLHYAMLDLVLCPKCIGRLAGVRYTDFYTSSGAVLAKELSKIARVQPREAETGASSNDDYEWYTTNWNKQTCQMCLGILQNDSCLFPYGGSAKKSRKRKPPWAGQAQREQAMQALDETLEFSPDTTDPNEGTKYLTPGSAVKQTVEHRGYDCRHGILSSSLPICIPVREVATRAWLSQKLDVARVPILTLQNFSEDIQKQINASDTIAHINIKEIFRTLLSKEVSRQIPSFQLLSQQEVEASLEDECIAEKLNIIPGDFGISLNVILNNVEADDDLRSRFSPDNKNAKNTSPKARISGGQVLAFLEKLGATEIPKNIHGNDLIPMHTRESTISANGSAQSIKDLSTTFFTVEVKRLAIYVWGKYCKYKRGLSQSPWYVDGKREGDSSVEELIAGPFAKESASTDDRLCCEAASYKFHSAGREDIDVRMLGTGRPFVIELLEPKRVTHLRSKDAMKSIEERINHFAQGDIEVNRLTLANKNIFSGLQSGASEKRKVYGCVIWCSHNVTPEFLRARIDSVTDLRLEQKTPVRVLHRRSLLSREKYVYRMKTEWLNSRYFLLEIETSAGTYVKEFVHGDLGRTWPNMGAILSGKTDDWRKGKSRFVSLVHKNPHMSTYFPFDPSRRCSKLNEDTGASGENTDLGFVEADMLQLDVLQVLDGNE